MVALDTTIGPPAAMAVLLSTTLVPVVPTSMSYSEVVAAAEVTSRAKLAVPLDEAFGLPTLLKVRTPLETVPSVAEHGNDARRPVVLGEIAVSGVAGIVPE